MDSIPRFYSWLFKREKNESKIALVTTALCCGCVNTGQRECFKENSHQLKSWSKLYRRKSTSKQHSCCNYQRHCLGCWPALQQPPVSSEHRFPCQTWHKIILHKFYSSLSDLQNHRLMTTVLENCAMLRDYNVTLALLYPSPSYLHLQLHQASCNVTGQQHVFPTVITVNVPRKCLS